MKKQTAKPTPEAKALSLFFMAYKNIDPIYKKKAKRINRQWDLVGYNQISKTDYMKEVNAMLEENGGYTAVIEKTVKYYIDKTGEWTLKGDDKYCVDALKIAETILNK